MAEEAGLIPRYGKWKKVWIGYRMWSGAIKSNFHFPIYALDKGFPALKATYPPEVREAIRPELGMIFRRTSRPDEVRLMGIPDAKEVWGYYKELQDGWGDTRVKRLQWLLQHV